MAIRKCYTITILLYLSTCSDSLFAIQPQTDLTIFSDSAAPQWDQGYPVGNGRIGMLTLGAYPKENLFLNENTVWARQEFIHPKNTAETMPEIRALALAGNYKEADQLWEKKLLTPMWRPASYEFTGMAILEHLNSGQPITITNSLDLTTGLSRSEARYTDGIIQREVIALRERDVIAVRVTTTRPHGLHFKLTLTHPRDTVNVDENKLVLTGQGAGGGTRYQSHLLLRPDAKGSISSTNDALELKGGQEAIILYTAATDYNNANPDQPLTSWKNKANEWLIQSATADWNTLSNEGQIEILSYMKRFYLDLGKSAPEIKKLPTGERIERYKNAGSDPDLEELLFQFGRYCLITCNRKKGLPANLQGIWSAGLKSPWSADYHLNINLQMNYWPSELTGLSELHQPMLDLVTDMQPAGQRLAKEIGHEGFCCGHAINAWKKTRFSGNRALWAASPMNGAWITAHLMEHYRFTGDRGFLEKQAWPAIQENARFILSWLHPDKKTGEWITGPGTSPENQFTYQVGTNTLIAAVSCGTTHDLMLSWESLSDLIEAAEVLGIDNDLVKQARSVLPQLAEGPIGLDGRLQEWREPFGEKNPGHRHVSHAYGFFPGRQYNVIENPERVDAIRKSLDFRIANGGGRTGWSRAWLINIEACLLRPDAAYKNIRSLFSRCINPNLFDLHPPFQIDGNFGYTSGVCTMLLQSQIMLDSGERVLWILPALPKEWPEGRVQGLHARGGAILNIDWSPNTVTAEITATRDGNFQIRCREKTQSIKLKAGEKKVYTFSRDYGCAWRAGSPGQPHVF